MKTYYVYETDYPGENYATPGVVVLRAETEVEATAIMVNEAQSGDRRMSFALQAIIYPDGRVELFGENAYPKGHPDIIFEAGPFLE